MATAQAEVRAVPSASIVICTHTAERIGLLHRALDAVGAQVAPEDEVIVVVDHNAALRGRLDASAPGVRVLENDRDAGLSGARDAGVAAAGGDVVVFLDDDAVPRAGWLEHLRGAFDDPAVAAVGGAIAADWETGRPGWFPDELGWVVGCDYRGLPGDGAQLRNPIGANMAVRRDALLRVGSFDGALGRDADRPMGGEETELAIRIRQDAPDASIVRVASSVVDHHVPRSRARLRYVLRRSWYEGISKGRMAARVGLGDGLSSERRYVLRTISTGVLRHVAAPITRRDLAGPLRAGVLVAAFAVTTAGFVVGGRR